MAAFSAAILARSAGERLGERWSIISRADLAAMRELAVSRAAVLGGGGGGGRREAIPATASAGNLRPETVWCVAKLKNWNVLLSSSPSASVAKSQKRSREAYGRAARLRRRSWRT